MTLNIDWDKIDPKENHRDAVNESMSPLFDMIAEKAGVGVEDLSWNIYLVKEAKKDA